MKKKKRSLQLCNFGIRIRGKSRKLQGEKIGLFQKKKKFNELSVITQYNEILRHTKKKWGNIQYLFFLSTLPTLYSYTQKHTLEQNS